MSSYLYADATTGEVLRFARNDDELGLLGGSVSGATLMEFDYGTNTALAEDIAVSISHYAYLVGVLRKDGTPVTVNADSPTETDRKALPTLKSQIEAYMALSDLAVPSDLTNIAVGSNAAAIVIYMNTVLLPRINQLDDLVQRTNDNTNASQRIFRILRYVATRFGIFS